MSNKNNKLQLDSFKILCTVEQMTKTTYEKMTKTLAYK